MEIVEGAWFADQNSELLRANELVKVNEHRRSFTLSDRSRLRKQSASDECGRSVPMALAQPTHDLFGRTSVVEKSHVNDYYKFLEKHAKHAKKKEGLTLWSTRVKRSFSLSVSLKKAKLLSIRRQTPSCVKISHNETLWNIWKSCDISWEF